VKDKTKLAKALAPVPTALRIAAVRSALETVDLSAPHFVLQQALDGPFTLTALLVDGDDYIRRPIAATGRTIAVPLPARTPITIRWSAVFGQDQLKAVGYYVTGGGTGAQPGKLEEKRNVTANATWTSRSHTVR
jgi:hypothetical protein